MQFCWRMSKMPQRCHFESFGRVVSPVQKIWRYCSESMSLKFRYTDALLLSPCFIGSNFTEYRDFIQVVLREKVGGCWWGTARAARGPYLSSVPQFSVLQQLQLPTFADVWCLISPSSAPEGQILPPPLIES